MDATYSESKPVVTSQYESEIERLSRLFGSYRAEWLKDKIFDFFTVPSYFPELTTGRPCMLIGGRGTGKTTVLRGLSYEGQYAINGRQPDQIKEWPFYGLYYRVNTNRVTAFRGSELSSDEWVRIFAHYFNLIICDMIFRFVDWYELHSQNSVSLSSKALSRVAVALHLNKSDSIHQLADQLDDARLKFEAYINNVADGNKPPLSMQGQPIDVLVEALVDLPHFAGKSFFFLIDEYENFSEYQQQVVNTLIKHSGQHYSFKIGVKELGWQIRQTLNENEHLNSPADYIRVNIAEKMEGETFKRFALSVINGRVEQIVANDHPIISDIRETLPGMTEDEEAEKLGVQELTQTIKSRIQKTIPDESYSIVAGLPELQIYMLQFWSEAKNQPLDTIINDFLSNRSVWQTRYNNYKHALLFTIRRRKSGIRKYYAGWDVFIQLAADNIRYLMELVDQSLLLHLHEEHHLTEPVSFVTQTRAAQNVGKKNLSELEGLTVYGAQLTKVVLGMGRVFQVMASDVSGHAPEVNQFHITDNAAAQNEASISQDEAQVDRLLKSAVMHLAILRSPGTKLDEDSETREPDYMMHPIFSPFFVYSYRRKRKMTISGAELIGLVKGPKTTISAILARNNRFDAEPLPEQLLLFEGYYGIRP